MTKLPMWENSIKGNLENSFWAEERIVNIPSSVTKLGTKETCL